MSSPIWESEDIEQRKERESRYTMRIVDHSKSPFLEIYDATLDHKPTGITLTGQGFPALHLLLPIKCHCSEASVGFPCVHIENNMRDQDEEMCEYLMDFHCRAWVIGIESAIRAYRGMLSRAAIWSSGGSVFDDSIPLWSTEHSVFEPGVLLASSVPGFAAAQHVIPESSPTTSPSVVPSAKTDLVYKSRVPNFTVLGPQPGPSVQGSFGVLELERKFVFGQT